MEFPNENPPSVFVGRPLFTASGFPPVVLKEKGGGLVFVESATLELVAKLPTASKEDEGTGADGLNDLVPKEEVGMVSDLLASDFEVSALKEEEVLAPLNPVLAPLNPVLAPLNPVLAPLNPVLAPLNPVLAPLNSPKENAGLLLPSLKVLSLKLDVFFTGVNEKDVAGGTGAVGITFRVEDKKVLGVEAGNAPLKGVGSTAAD